MSEANEMYDGIECLIKERIKHYENLQTHYDCEEYRRQGAICALEELLEMLNN